MERLNKQVTEPRKQKGKEMRLKKKKTHFLKYSKESVCRVGVRGGGKREGRNRNREVGGIK